MKAILVQIYLFLVIFFGNHTFYLFPWAHIHGKFNSADIGTALIMLGIFISLIKGKDIKIAKNPISIYIFLYFIMVGVHISLASIYHQQSVLDGIIIARHQFYYASFFVFLFFLENMDDVYRLMAILSGWCLVIVGLAIVNYFIPVVFHHQWAEGHGIRFGVKRAFIPQMGFCSIIYLWFLSNLTIIRRRKIRNGLGSISLLAAHFFRLSRMRVVGITATTLLLLCSQKKVKLLCLFVLLVLLAWVVAQFCLKENIMAKVFVTSVTDIADKSGTWKAREPQLQNALKEFKRHPIIGSGTALIRRSNDIANLRKNNELQMIAASADLGYPFWLRNYGIVGVIWLAFLLGTILIKGLSLVRRTEIEKVESAKVFVLCGIVNLILTGYTLNHFTRASGILLISLLGAIIYRTAEYYNRPQKSNEKMYVI